MSVYQIDMSGWERRQLGIKPLTYTDDKEAIISLKKALDRNQQM